MRRFRTALVRMAAVIYCSLWVILGLKLMDFPILGEAPRLVADIGPPSFILKDNSAIVALPTHHIHHNASRSLSLLDPFINQTNITAESLKVPENNMWFYEALKYTDMYDTHAKDRIITQLANTHRVRDSMDGSEEVKLILLPDTKGVSFDECAVTKCRATKSKADASSAHAIMFKSASAVTGLKKQPGQVWIYSALESPYHTSPLPAFLKDQVNWTATYRTDSTFVTPYERFVPYSPHIKSLPLQKSYAVGKTKKVAWFVSNCGARNGRLQYAHDLGKHIQVDIYGRCGDHKCPRSNAKQCFDMLNTQYKFYLAFENSNCKDYITEKFYWNGLLNDILPITMGAHPDEYRKVAPPHSFIHVDDFSSAKALADYLHVLDKNDTLYNEYFAWKGTGTFLNTRLMCRMCGMLHDKERKPSWYEDINEWWRGDTVCRRQGW